MKCNPRLTHCSVVVLAALLANCSGQGQTTLPGTALLAKQSPASSPVQSEDLRAFEKHAAMLATSGSRLMGVTKLHSISPGSIPAAPLDRNIHVSAEELNRLTSRERPQFVQNAPSWSQLSGSFLQVIVSPSDGTLWALVNSGSGPNYGIAHYVNGNWSLINGNGVRLAIDPNGDTLYCVNAAGGIWQYNIAAQTWSSIAGGANDITIGKDNTVYVLSNNGADSNGNTAVWHYANNVWQNLPGAGLRIAASWDPNTYQGTSTAVNAGGFFVLTAITGSGSGGGVIYYDDPGVGYLQVPGQAEAIAPVTGGLFAVGGSKGAKSESPIYFYEYSSQGWAEEPGDGISVAASQSRLYSVTSAGTIYTTPLILRNPIVSEFADGAVYNVSGVVEGSDQNLWYTDSYYGYIRSVSTGGTVTSYQLASNRLPNGIAAGGDSALWFTELGGNNVGRVVPGGSAVQEYPIPTASSSPFGIATGPDNALWFTEQAGNKIGRIAYNGTVTNEYPIPTPSSSPEYLTTGADGALWFTENASGKIGRVTTTGSVSEYPIPTASSAPVAIAAGPDGALWFTEFGGNKIGRITTGSSPAITEYPVPTASSAPLGITAGPDGALWFTENSADKVGRITTGGVISEYSGLYNQGGSIYSDIDSPYAITTGPSGALYFTQNGEMGVITLQ